MLVEQLLVEARDPDSFEPLLRVGVAAEKVGLHPKTLGRWRREGRVPAVALKGGRYGYRLTQVVSAMLADGIVR